MPFPMLVFAAIFSPIAGLIAVLITYEEFSHHYPDWKRPLRLALQAGFATVVVFFVMSMIASYFLDGIVAVR
ncbi:MAG: hypothetical protein M1482_00080 [Chloroflexi bacterium]|nr:hypothetical protein [Chloroflexota bacterium]